jgi:hypothetical protein
MSRERKSGSSNLQDKLYVSILFVIVAITIYYRLLQTIKIYFSLSLQ